MLIIGEIFGSITLRPAPLIAFGYFLYRKLSLGACDPVGVFLPIRVAECGRDAAYPSLSVAAALLSTHAAPSPPLS